MTGEARRWLRAPRAALLTLTSPLTRVLPTLLLALTAAIAPTAAAGTNDTFSITLEQPVSNGVPGPGAGNIEVAGAIDTYTFTITETTEIYAQELGGGCLIGWTLTAPSGATVFNDTNICGANPGLRTLSQPGTYTVTVSGAGSTTGTYGFVLWQVNAPQNFPLTLESAVSAGVPGPGAGTLEEPGAIDRYTFSIAQPISIFAEELSGGCSIRWTLTAPSGAVVFTDANICGADPGVRSLSELGTYTVTVDSPVGATGAYGFILYQLNAPQQFTIGLKQTVADGVPAPGAGRIEEPGAIDLYDLTISEPTGIFADYLSGPCSLRFWLTAPSGAVLVNGSFLCTDGAGIVQCTELGVYTVRVQSLEAGTGAYSFVLYDLNEPQTFPLAVGDTVSNGVPAPGAGLIEEPGAKDIYLLPITSPVTVFFNSLLSACGFQWTLTAPGGATIFSTFACLDGGEHLLSEIGTYTLTVASGGSNTGPYSFSLVSVNPPQVFTLAPEFVVTNGQPAAGAGNLEASGSVDLYQVTLPAGAQFIPFPLSGSCSLRMSMTTPGGATLFNDAFLCGAAPIGLFTATTAGVYTVRVEAPGGETGTYSLVVLLLDAPQEFVLAIGDTVSKGFPGRGAGVLPEPFSVDRYLFSADAGMEVCLEELSGDCALGWSMRSPSGELLTTDILFCSSSPGRIALPETGVYTITVGGEANDVGPYSFTLHEARSADIAPATPATGGQRARLGDCVVNAADLAILLGAWGPCADCDADLDGDGQVNASDLAILLGEWG